jgi:polysaccharide biosynthesis protein PelE
VKPGAEGKPGEKKPDGPGDRYVGADRVDNVMGAVALGTPLPLYLLGLFLEALATLTLLLDLVADHRLQAFLFLHLLGTLISGLALFRWMPRLLRRRRLTAYPSLCVVVFFLPLLGALGLGFGLVLPLLLPHKNRNEAPIVSTFIPDLPYRPLVVSSQPIYGVVGLVGVIRHASETAARVRAVMATRQLSDQYAVPILQVALRDPVDDVRLLAYALLDGKERAIYGNIKQLNGRLAEAPKATHGGLHKRLAHEHWELVYLGLAQGEVLAHVLNAGLKHAQLAREELPTDAGLCFLYGRMRSAQGSLEEASALFDEAEALGLPRQALLPYRADVAFRQRRWDEVRTLLSGLSPESKKRMPLSAVVAYWRAA